MGPKRFTAIISWWYKVGMEKEWAKKRKKVSKRYDSQSMRREALSDNTWISSSGCRTSKPSCRKLELFRMNERKRSRKSGKWVAKPQYCANQLCQLHDPGCIDTKNVLTLQIPAQLTRTSASPISLRINSNDRLTCTSKANKSSTMTSMWYDDQKYRERVKI